MTTSASSGGKAPKTLLAGGLEEANNLVRSPEPAIAAEMAPGANATFVLFGDLPRTRLAPIKDTGYDAVRHLTATGSLPNILHEVAGVGQKSSKERKN